MAKAKSKKKAAKAVAVGKGGGKLPKAIAGVKIGKELRNAIEPVMRFAGHPLVGDLLAGVMVAGAEHLIDGKGKRKRAAAESDAQGAKAKGGDGEPSTVGLLLAVAAGEIASQIVSAYGTTAKAAPKRAKSDSPQKARATRKTPARRKPKKVPSA